MKKLNYLFLISISCLIISCATEVNDSQALNFSFQGVKDLSITAPGFARNSIDIIPAFSGPGSDPLGDIFLRVVNVPDNVSYTLSDNANAFPFTTLLDFKAESDAVEGDYALKIEGSYSEDFKENEVVSESFMLTITKDTPTDTSTSATDCGDFLAGQYSGPDNCAPQGFGDVVVDIVYIADGDSIILTHEFFSTNIVGSVSCNNNTFTIPNQNVTVTGGAQSGTISGDGNFTMNTTDSTVLFNYTTEIQGSSLSCSVDLDK